MLQSVEDFFAAITDDFTEPHIAVDVDKKGAVAQAGGLGVSDDGRIDEIIPYFDDFGFDSATIDPQSRKDFRHHSAHLTSAQSLGLFQRRQIKSAELRQNALARRRFARA